MSSDLTLDRNRLHYDLIAGLVVFLVALPLCLGVALASGAPLVSGLIAGIVGGIVVGAISGSHTSVSGPAAGLTAIVAAQIVSLGSFERFLLAVVIAGILQIGLGLLKAGQLASFAPSSVIKGLLAAIGVILILKQIPHLLGHDTDPEGDMSFDQPDKENTLTEIYGLFVTNIHFGAAAIGVASIAVLYFWDHTKWLKKTQIPGPLVVVMFGLGMSYWLESVGGRWGISPSHRVQVPVINDLAGLNQFFSFPDFRGLASASVYKAGAIIAVVASLETLLNLGAVDRLDTQNRKSPPNRELIAQGVGNMVCGMIGGIPVTSVIVRSSVNISSGGRTKLATLVHGVLLILCIALLPTLLNQIPIACLAAILLVTGFKLASPKLFRQMWSEGRYQFVPFIITVLAIVFTDLVVGVLIGLAISLGFILNSNFRRPLRTIMEKHVGGDVLRIELANQVSFLNRGAIDQALNRLQPGDHVLFDANHTDYIDPDVLAMIREYSNKVAAKRNIKVSLDGFREKYVLKDEVQFVDYSNRDLQDKLTPDQVLQILWEGNKRFRSGKTIRRDVQRQLQGAAGGQHPLAVVLSCIDSRTSTEVVFDLGLGDIFSVRVAGNVISDRILGSIEYGCAVAGAKLVLVMGHTSCGAVAATVDLASGPQPPVFPRGCKHLEPIVSDIMESINVSEMRGRLSGADGEAKRNFIDDTARRNVFRTVIGIMERSPAIKTLADEGRVAVVGAMYDVATGDIDMVYVTGAMTDGPAMSISRTIV